MLVDVLKNDQVVCFIYDTPSNLMRSMLRFQEHYESPKFTGKVFTRQEFKKWYIKNSPGGKKSGKFTYYSDWCGCNFKDRAVNAFREGLFNPLSKSEKEILANLPKGPFYAIGTSLGAKDPNGVLLHEYAHALYYLDPIYKNYADTITAKWDGTKEQNDLIKLGYSEEVRKDETQAFIISGIEIVKPQRNFEEDRIKLLLYLHKKTKIKKIIKQWVAAKDAYLTNRDI